MSLISFCTYTRNFLVWNVCIQALLYTKPLVHNHGPTLRLIESLDPKGSKTAVIIGIGGLITLLSIEHKIDFSYESPSKFYVGLAKGQNKVKTYQN